MKRGDIIIVALRAPFDKPRPAVVVQAELLDESENVVVAPMTSDLAWIPKLRILVQPSASNGLRKPSEIMIDLIQAVPLSRVGGWAGTLEAATMRQVDRALRQFLGLRSAPTVPLFPQE